jgi:hypothetical protein
MGLLGKTRYQGYKVEPVAIIVVMVVRDLLVGWANNWR